MKLIPANRLVPGKEYYMKYMIPTPGTSGKKIGTFVRRLPYDRSVYPGQLYFRKLRDMPGATMPSGFGDLSENSYYDSPELYLFYEPEVKAIEEHALKRSALKTTLKKPSKIVNWWKPIGNVKKLNKVKALDVSALNDTEAGVIGNRMFPDMFPDWKPPGEQKPPGGGKRSRKTKKYKKSRKYKKYKK
jgi:hypothetical protein